MEAKNTALIIIDVQEGFDDYEYWGGNRNNPDMETNISRLLKVWRKLKLPVFHVKHNSENCNSPLHPLRPGNRIKDVVIPATDETVICKNVNSAFIGTGLENKLKGLGITAVVITGLQTDHCVSTTARMAANLSFETFVISDATATFDRKDMNDDVKSAEIIHNINLTSLRGEFATILNTEEIIAEVHKKRK